VLAGNDATPPEDKSASLPTVTRRKSVVPSEPQRLKIDQLRVAAS